MTADTSAGKAGQIGALRRSDCLERLRGGTIGRVGWNTVDGPQILPVTYAVRGESVVFRTSPHGALSELRHPRQVAFEVDEFDVDTRAGWSVVVQGVARAAARPAELVELWRHLDPAPWAAGDRNLFIVISLNSVTGRVVTA